MGDRRRREAPALLQWGPKLSAAAPGVKTYTSAPALTQGDTVMGKAPLHPLPLPGKPVPCLSEEGSLFFEKLTGIEIEQRDCNL